MKPKFGDLIREARLTGDLSLREAAKRLEVSPTYLSQIENGKIVPPMPEVLRRIAALYSIPFEDLLQRAQNRLSQSVEEDAANDRVVAALLRKVLDLDGDTRILALRSILKKYQKLTDAEIDLLVRKMSVDLKRLDRGREGLFAADVKPRRLTRQWIESLAERFLGSNGLSRATYHPPTKVDVLIEKHPQLRLVVDDALDHRPDPKPEILGISHWHVDGVRRVIKVNPKLVDDPSDTADHRCRFTLGHELFHAIEHLPRMDQRFKQKGACLREAPLLESGLASAELERAVGPLEVVPAGPTWWLRQRSGSRPLQTNEDWREWQANVFSSALLMPEWSVRKEFAERFGGEAISSASDPRETAWELATTDVSMQGGFPPLHRLFQVSRQAMAIRLISLGLISR